MKCTSIPNHKARFVTLHGMGYKFWVYHQSTDTFYWNDSPERQHMYKYAGRTFYKSPVDACRAAIKHAERNLYAACVYRLYEDGSYYPMFKCQPWGEVGAAS